MEKATLTSLHRKGLDNDPLIYNYVLSSETSAHNRVICASSSVEHRRCRHRHHQRHGGIRNTGKVLNCGESGNKMSGKIKMVGKVVNSVALSPHLLLHKYGKFVVFLNFACRHQRMSCTRREVKTEQFRFLWTLLAKSSR